MPIISIGLRYTNISCIADQPHVIKTNYKDRIPVAAPTPLFYRERNGPFPPTRDRCSSRTYSHRAADTANVSPQYCRLVCSGELL